MLIVRLSYGLSHQFFSTIVVHRERLTLNGWANFGVNSRTRRASSRQAHSLANLRQRRS